MYRMGAELCTLNGEVMIRVGSKLVDSNEVDEGDRAWVEFELGEVTRLYPDDADGVILKFANFNDTDIGDVDGVRFVLINGNDVGAEDMAKVSTILLGNLNVVDGCLGVEVEIDESNDVAVDGWVRIEFDKGSDALVGCCRN